MPGFNVLHEFLMLLIGVIIISYILCTVYGIQYITWVGLGQPNPTCIFPIQEGGDVLAGTWAGRAIFHGYLGG